MAVNSQSFARGAVSALCPSTERQDRGCYQRKLWTETNRRHIYSPTSSKCQRVYIQVDTNGKMGNEAHCYC